MAPTKVDDVLVSALGSRRTYLAAKIAEIQAVPLSELQAELSSIEQKLKEIDPAILSLAEEAQAAEAAPIEATPVEV